MATYASRFIRMTKITYAYHTHVWFKNTIRIIRMNRTNGLHSFRRYTTQKFSSSKDCFYLYSNKQHRSQQRLHIVQPITGVFKGERSKLPRSPQRWQKYSRKWKTGSSKFVAKMHRNAPNGKITYSTSKIFWVQYPERHSVSIIRGSVNPRFVNPTVMYVDYVL